jgi:hypothetical protein
MPAHRPAWRDRSNEDVATVDIELGRREVLAAAGHQAPHVVLVHVRDDDRADAVRLHADRAERVRQTPGLAERARRARIDQDPALPVIDEVLVEDEPDSALLGGGHGVRRGLDLFRGPPRKVGERHVGIAVAQRRDRETPDPDLGRGHQR